MPLGDTLRAAREKAGLSVDDIMHVAHVAPQCFGAYDKHLSHLLAQGHLGEALLYGIGWDGCWIVFVVATRCEHHGHQGDGREPQTSVVKIDFHNKIFKI